MADLSRYNNIDIPQVNFTGSVFKPQELKFEAPDSRLALDAVKSLETRINNSNQATADFETMGTNLGKDLSQDRETQTWWNETIGKYREEIDNLSKSGNYGEAMRKARDLGASLGRDPEYLARKQHYKEYTDKVNEINNNKNLSSDTKKRWLDTHRYSWNDRIEEPDSANIRWGKESDNFNGVFGGDEIVDDVDIDNLVAVWTKSVNPNTSATSSGTKTGTSVENKTNGIATGSSSASQTQSGSQTTVLSLKDLQKVRDDWFKESYHKKQINQKFMNDITTFKELEKRLANSNPGDTGYTTAKQQYEELKKILSDGAGGTISANNEIGLKQYFENLVNGRLKAYSYKNTKVESFVGSQSSSSNDTTTSDQWKRDDAQNAKAAKVAEDQTSAIREQTEELSKYNPAAINSGGVMTDTYHRGGLYGAMNGARVGSDIGASASNVTNMMQGKDNKKPKK